MLKGHGSCTDCTVVGVFQRGKTNLLVANKGGHFTQSLRIFFRIATTPYNNRYIYGLNNCSCIFSSISSRTILTIGICADQPEIKCVSTVLINTFLGPVHGAVHDVIKVLTQSLWPFRSDILNLHGDKRLMRHVTFKEIKRHGG